MYNSISAGALTIHKNTRHITMLFKLMIKAVTDTAIWDIKQQKIGYHLKDNSNVKNDK